MINNFKHFNESIGMKKYVYKYDDYFWYCDDVEGDMLVSNIEDALILSEKKIKYWELDTTLLSKEVIGQTMWTDSVVEVEILHPMERIEV